MLKKKVNFLGRYLGFGVLQWALLPAPSTGIQRNPNLPVPFAGLHAAVVIGQLAAEEKAEDIETASSRPTGGAD